MRTIVVVAAILPLALAVGACTKQDDRTVVKPELSTPSLALEAEWVSDRNEVAAAASAAAVHPLVRATLAEHEADRLTYRPEFALRGRGVSNAGHAIGVTILPYVTGGDPTHATFVSLLESDGEAMVSHAELIWGRDPRPDETGYEAFVLGGARGWVREDDLRGVPAAAGGALSPERFKWPKFFTCFTETAPGLCAQGAAIGAQIAPGMPQAAAIGCGAGAALAGISCAAQAVGK